VTQSRRFGGKLFYFDFENAAQPLFASLGGNYSQLDSQNNSLLLNPFTLPDKEDRKHFLAEFFVSLVYFAQEPVPENEIMLIPDFVDRLITANVHNLAAAIEIFNVPEAQNLYRELLRWNSEEFSYIFNAQQELDWSQQLNAFDLTFAQKEVSVIAPIMSYMLHRIESVLDGSPSLLVLKEAWDLIDNPISGPVFAEFLQRLKSRNCVVIMTSLDNEKLVASENTAAISAEISTRVFLAQPEPPEFYKAAFGLNDEEIEIIKTMEISQGHVFFKRGDEAVIASLNFDKMIEFKKIFYADELTLSAMDHTIEAAHNADGNNMTLEGWFAQYVEVLREIEKEKNAREKEKQRQERVTYLRQVREGRD
jgi:type IV secretion system protein VirB4